MKTRVVTLSKRQKGDANYQENADAKYSMFSKMEMFKEYKMV
jgi:hypothetical protein